MRFNRSVPPCAVIPVLIYPDPSAAADWLSKAFGFTIRLRIANHRIQMGNEVASERANRWIVRDCGFTAQIVVPSPNTIMFRSSAANVLG